jgi:hypothetical protein
MARTVGKRRHAAEGDSPRRDWEQEMTPTNELRFVERTAYVDAASGYLKLSQTIRILQQKWVTYWSDDMGGSPRESEWRDVPLVEEKP